MLIDSTFVFSKAFYSPVQEHSVLIRLYVKFISLVFIQMLQNLEKFTALHNTCVKLEMK